MRTGIGLLILLAVASDAVLLNRLRLLRNRSSNRSLEICRWSMWHIALRSRLNDPGVSRRRRGLLLPTKQFAHPVFHAVNRVR